ncbi:di-heme oxidoredictase family protein [Nitratireductor sp. XY-223]|uniref:di-heme oxidoredictase family protein n=1 Tax=Nitratireductor sp. XY-223 TaxID=2561926 RepID=UPI0010AAB95A|nr:di-heme oxidoredictase family protein [Nitratireductor sp. XY-223]
MPSRTLILAAAAFVALFAGAAPSGDAASPWTEATIGAPTRQADFSGRLSAAQLQALMERGEALFTAKFTTVDGVGRPMATQAIIPTKSKRPIQQSFQRLPGMDSNACSSCHNDPVTGGAGDFVANVFVSEGFTNADFDTTDPQFSNERNTNHLMGAGLIELLAREMTAELQAQRSMALNQARSSGEPHTVRLTSKGVDFGAVTAEPDGIVDLSGIDGVDSDLVIRPFSQKGVIGSLRQFTVNALNHHHGIQAVERFGPRWTGEDDFDEDGVEAEMGAGDVSALVAWQAGRPPPSRIAPENDQWRRLSERGGDVFDDIGCGGCHRPALPLESLVFADPGPVDGAGTLRHGETENGAVYDLALLEWAKSLPRDESGAVLVPLFGDLKRHKIADQQVSALGNELLGQRFVDRDVFMTSELWGIASTAPYGHRGDFTTLDEVIRAHGGAGRDSRDRYVALDDTDRAALIAFLKTLVIAP